MSRHLPLWEAARRHDLAPATLDADLEPPPPPRRYPSPSAGWDEGRTTFRVWRSDWDKPGWRAKSADVMRARAEGLRVEVIDDPKPGERLRITTEQVRDPNWMMFNQKQMKTDAIEIID